VRYWLRGAECWKHANDWPLPASSPKILYLDRGNPSELAVQSLNENPPGVSGKNAFISLPSHRFYVPALDIYETQILRFSTAPYAHETEITGPVKLRLMVSASAIDCYIIARLSDLGPDGKRTKLAWGWLLASHRTIDRDRSNPTEIVHDHRAQAAKQLVPGVPSELCFSLTPIANLFKPGHRLELEIASRPELLVSEAGEGFDMFTWDPVPYRCRTTIHTGGEQPSYLEVMVVPIDGEIAGEDSRVSA
jgi:predicted acyl esterase